MIITIKDIDLDRIDGVILDLDGTVYDKTLLPFRLTMGAIGMCRLGTFVAERLTRKTIRGRYYSSTEAYYEAFFSGIGIGIPALKRRAKRWYTTEYWPLMLRTLEKHYRVRPWMVELIKDLRAAGKKVAVYSDYEDAEKRLLILGLDTTLLDAILTSPELGGLKPCKESMQKVAQAMGVEPKRCLVIGDGKKADGRGAAAIGASFIFCKK